MKQMKGGISQLLAVCKFVERNHLKHLQGWITVGARQCITLDWAPMFLVCKHFWLVRWPFI